MFPPLQVPEFPYMTNVDQRALGVLWVKIWPTDKVRGRRKTRELQQWATESRGLTLGKGLRLGLEQHGEISTTSKGFWRVEDKETKDRTLTHELKHSFLPGLCRAKNSGIGEERKGNHHNNHQLHLQATRWRKAIFCVLGIGLQAADFFFSRFRSRPMFRRGAHGSRPVSDMQQRCGCDATFSFQEGAMLGGRLRGD